MIRTLVSRAGRLVAAMTLGLLASAAPTARAQDESAARSVVLIRCALPGGVAKATGFVWPESGYVVTALHAVAGCQEIDVSSEATKGSALGTLVRADLEADLALLELDNDLLGVPAVGFAEAPPDTLADHFTYGYPLAAEQMIGLRIEFGGGLTSDVTTLGGAFASDELEDLFRGQSYPTRDTQILRVNSTIQPGRSGAPIFDGDGNVVAIVDGGLLGGWRTINWSIPAYVYLPDLLTSEDPPPEGPSAQTVLHSSVTPTDPVEVTFERQGEAAAAEAGDVESAFVLVRQIGLSEFAEMNGLGGEGSMVEDIRTLVGDDAVFQTLSFDIYEDTVSGATIGVPSGTELYWNPDLEVIEAVNEWLTVRLTVRVSREGSFQEAFATAEDFMARHAEEIVWNEEQASEPVVDVYDEEAEVVELLLSDAGKVPGTDEEVELILGVYASGPDFLGTTVTAVYGDETWTDVDQVDYLMMEFGSRFLTNFALN